MQRRLATAASALQRSVDADSSRSRRLPMALHYLVYVRLLHGSGRRSAALHGWGSILARESSGSRVSGCDGWPSGCFSFRISRTVASPPPAFTFSGKTPQLSSKLKRSRRAALIFPLKTNFVKNTCELVACGCGIGWCWQMLLYCVAFMDEDSILPDFHASIRRCKQMRCSLAFGLRCGLCNSSMGIVIAARMAKGSSADFSA